VIAHKTGVDIYGYSV